jgi:hypothetical protein
MCVSFIAAVNQSHSLRTAAEVISVTATRRRTGTHDQMISKIDIKTGMQTAGGNSIHPDTRHFIIGTRIAYDANGAFNRS